MPPPCSRKKPFSSKQKKKQLQDRREHRREKEEAGQWGGNRGRWQKDGACGHHGHRHRHQAHDSSGSDDEATNTQAPRMCRNKGYDPNRFRLKFQKERRAEIEQRKELARQPFIMLPEEAKEIDIDQLYQPGSALDMPKRPAWDYTMSRQQVQASEEKYFRAYVDTLFEKYNSDELSYLELNLETWQQLWRVLEMADIVLLITDIRHPALHFSPALYQYVTGEMKKPLILVLNKIDLAPPALVVAWKHFFSQRFPGIHIVCFTSFPKDKADSEDPSKVVHKKRRRGAFTAVGPKQLFDACQKIVQGKVDISDWHEKIESEMTGAEDDGEHVSRITMEEADGSFHQHSQYHDGVLTIGCCGYPNVGKSSLMNGLVGHKVVSVSKTPGHTKHFQTIYLTPHVKLCDSPGLVFPSLVPKPLQILAGIYPIAQVREPYTAVGFLAERINLPLLLGLRHPDQEGPKANNLQWSAWDICDAWAAKRGFLTAKVARHDSYRAANHILRFALEGRLCLCMRPPQFTKRKEYWESLGETEEIGRLQDAHRSANHCSDSDGEPDLHIPHSDEEFEKLMRQQHDSDKDINEAGDNSEDTDNDSPTSNVVSTNNPFALLRNDDQ